MTKYCIIYNGDIVYGFKRYIKNSDTIEYSNPCTYVNTKDAQREIILFDTALMMKIWLILQSTLASKLNKIASLADEKRADYFISKKKYHMKQLITGTIQTSLFEKPYLFEFVICEYDEVNKCLK